QIVSKIEMSNPAGRWVYTHSELNQIPIDSLLYINVIPLQKVCVEFQQTCISFGWFVGEPQYITFADGTTTGFNLHVDLKITEKGDFDFTVEDMYQVGLKLQEFLIEFKEQPSEAPASDVQEHITMPSFPNFSFPNYYSDNRSFHYELPGGFAALTIKNKIYDGLVTDYQLVMASGDLVDVTRSIKEQGLNFSRFSSPLVSVDAIANTFTVTVTCLLNDLSDETTYTAARFTIADNTVISTDFVRQATQGRVCELAD
ncbi:hypothetical protein, partial [Alkalimonas mucilaginosa]